MDPLPGSEFVPFSDMPDETMFAPTPYVYKVFVGGLRHDATREEIARIVVWITGVPMCRDNVIIFNGGSSVIHLPSAETAELFMKFSEHVLYEEGGVRIHDNPAALFAYSHTLTASPHPMVFEPAKARTPLYPPAQQWGASLYPTPQLIRYDMDGNLQHAQPWLPFLEDNIVGMRQRGPEEDLVPYACYESCGT